MWDNWLPKLVTVSLPALATEYRVQIPAKAGGISVRNRAVAIVRMAFEPGHVAGSVEPYVNIGTNVEWRAPEHLFTRQPITLHFATAAINNTVEVIYWERG